MWAFAEVKPQQCISVNEWHHRPHLLFKTSKPISSPAHFRATTSFSNEVSGNGTKGGDVHNICIIYVIYVGLVRKLYTLICFTVLLFTVLGRP